ncbi:DUF7003 family protein [Flectobacillus sp. BAB-3569]|uniref:DUF7003 family protein n=1 Tax=Flectobacillus sp. BAB-3569 TaxID=1509483 RepID=UPI000BA34DB3|nr:hypothetical protein [Flectobacillus sp. BAB-3569]NBA78649.1 hypothetical protein [Emticicia sp. ODNR4P]PAC29173.1 hypothetical protein BWI92_16200 [Flectobacillus sp. BAB-3569]
MTEEDILNTLDHSNDGYYCSFVELGHPYSYLLDTRLNVFRGDNDHWAIAVERLGYNPRAGAIVLDINYYGNCLKNLEFYNERPTNCYSIDPIDFDNFNDTIDGETLKSDAIFWLVRGQEVSLSHNQEDYLNAGIELKEYEADEISAEEVGRLVVSQNPDLFRATDNELYKSIPKDLKKILVLDEWFHKDFQLQISPTMTDEHLRQTFELNKNLTGLGGMTFENFVQAVRYQEMINNGGNRKIWKNNRPSSYETWQLIAKVIVANDPMQYNPTLAPNTHWTNWTDSGSM